MAAVAQSKVVVDSRAFARLEQEIAIQELRENFVNITRLANIALKSPEGVFAKNEREIIHLLTSGEWSSIEKVAKVCQERYFRLLPLLMRLAPMPQGDIYREDFAKRCLSDRSILESLLKNDSGEPEKILPGLFLGGILSCKNFQKQHQSPLIISLMGSKQMEFEHAEGCTINEICLFEIEDRNDSFDLMAYLASGKKREKAEDTFELVFKKIDQALLDQRPILFHCYAGQSRSAVLFAVYLVKRFGLTADQAMNFLMLKRKAVKPNVGLMDSLRKYAEVVRPRDDVSALLDAMDFMLQLI